MPNQTVSAETKPATEVAAVCDRCGRDCKQGEYQIRYFGPRDPQTNYQDEEVVCLACLDDAAEDYDEYEEERYAEGDRQFTEMYECGEI